MGADTLGGACGESCDAVAGPAMHGIAGAKNPIVRVGAF